jgi:UDP-N-acetylglucosamine 2-epimerase (non-hydrolysing)
MLRAHNIELAPNVTMVDPIGYADMLTLMVHARAVITDSGTVVEETAVLGVPSVQMRRSTERPQVYDCRSSVKFDPGTAGEHEIAATVRKLRSLEGTSWQHGLGDGHASERIVDDLLSRLEGGWRGGHDPADASVPVDRSYRSDGLDDPSS